MARYAWPGWGVNAFELRVQSNTRAFASPFGGNTQMVDLLGEYWVARVDIVPTTDPVEAAAREAFWDRLKGGVSTITIGHLKRNAGALGTTGGQVPATWLTTAPAVAQWKTASAANATWQAGDTIVAVDTPPLSLTVSLRSLPGRQLLAGRLIGLGAQMVRVMSSVTFDAAGNATVEVYPRPRSLIPAYTVVELNNPTADFMLKGATPPTTYVPGYAQGTSVELIERIS